MSHFEIAREWYELGLVCLPCYKGTKAFLKGCSPKRTKPDLAQLAKWFQGDVNIALVTGKSELGNLVILDFDNVPEFVRWRQENDFQTRIDQTRRGFHIYFWVECDDWYEGEFEVKQQGQTILLPPSIASGWKYKIFEDAEIMKVDRLEDVTACRSIPQSREKAHRRAQVNLTITGDHNVVFFPYSGDSRSIFRDIRNHLSLLDYLSEFQPVRQSERFYMAFCPGHEDTNRSLSIDNLNGLCSCFNPGCKLHNERGLDVVGLHATLRGISNFEAALELSE